MSKFFTIDVHNHILPEFIPDFKKQFGHGGFIVMSPEKDGMIMRHDDGTFFRAVEKNCYSISHRIEDMDRLGVNVQVLSTVPVLFSYWAKPNECQAMCRHLNNDLAEKINAHPKKFLGLGTLPLIDIDLAIEEVRYIKSIGLSGVQIGSHIGPINLDDSSLYSLYEELEKLNLSVLVHPWDMMGGDTMERYWLPWLVGMPAEGSRAISSMVFGGIFDRFPKMKVLFAHCGGSFLGTLGRIDHAYHSRPDLCAVNISKAPSEYLKSFYIDTITHDPETLLFAIKKMGVDRMALGTDYPFPLGEHHPGKMIVEMNQLTDENKKQLLSTTALDWLGESIERFI